MKISIVTISYNQRDYLGACIDSVAAQEGPWEHIVCDAGSTDGSRELIEARREHFSTIVLERDDGPADGLNKGFAQATGEIFYYLNSDDVVLPGAFAQARAAFAQYAGIDVIYGDGLMVDARGEVMRHMRSAPFMSAYIYHCGGGAVVQQATFFRATAFRRSGGFNTANRACWDGELLARLSRTGSRFRHIPRDWGGFRIHRQSISGSGDTWIEERYRREINRMFADTYGREISPVDRLAGRIWRTINAFAKRIGA